MKKILDDIEYRLNEVNSELGTDFGPITQRTMREDTEKCVGIYLYESRNDEEDLEGDTVFEAIKAHIQVNSEKSDVGIDTAEKFVRAFVKKFEKRQTRSTQEGLVYVDKQHIGPKVVTYKNGYGIHVCVCNIDIKYTLDEE